MHPHGRTRCRSSAILIALWSFSAGAELGGRKGIGGLVVVATLGAHARHGIILIIMRAALAETEH